MSLQWTAIAAFLYAEIFVCVLLLIPWISAKWWQRLFRSSFGKTVESYSKPCFIFFLTLLVVCFLDSIREIRKYNHPDQDDTNLVNNPNAVEKIHSKLFRAQRNFYIAGFSLFLWFVIRRLFKIIDIEATQDAQGEAAMKQAKSASETAKNLMSKNADVEEQLKRLDELQLELKSTKEQLQQKEVDVLAMKSQSAALATEYDRMSDLYRELQDKYDSLIAGDGDKKSN